MSREVVWLLAGVALILAILWLLGLRIDVQVT